MTKFQFRLWLILLGTLMTSVPLLAQESELEQDARISLLNYYSSASLQHGTFLVTLTIGLFGTAYYLEDHPFRIVLFIIILTAMFHTFGRLLLWSNLATAIINASPKGDGNLLDRLHNSASERVINGTVGFTSQFAKHFAGAWYNYNSGNWLLGYVIADFICVAVLSIIFGLRKRLTNSLQRLYRRLFIH